MSVTLSSRPLLLEGVAFGRFSRDLFWLLLTRHAIWIALLLSIRVRYLAFPHVTASFG
ncbi:MAG TPA: hypothetical protein VF660_07360 [Actinomycetota bacterium]